MTPLEMLEAKLESLKGDLQKSKDAFDLDLIPESVHLTHKENIEPKIQEFKDAIYTLKIFGR